MAFRERLVGPVRFHQDEALGIAAQSRANLKIELRFQIQAGLIGRALRTRSRFSTVMRQQRFDGAVA